MRQRNQQPEASTAATPSQQPQTAATDGDAIRDYILENPEVVRQALVILEQRRLVEEARADEQMIADHADALYNDGFSFVGGNPDGSITLVEFQDYRCGYCKRAHDDVQRLVAEDGDIRMIIKEFPILGEDSLTTSRLAIAAMITEGPEAYKRISDAMMTYAGPVNEGAMKRLAKSANLDLDTLTSRLEDPEIHRRIGETHRLANQLSISGTPTFIIGNRMVRGYVPYDELKRLVALERGS